MIQNIEPKLLNNQYENRKAGPRDLFIACQANKVMVKEGAGLRYPCFADFAADFPHLSADARYLFSIDDRRFFGVEGQGLANVRGWEFIGDEGFRSPTEQWQAFAGVLGLQLCRWYDAHRYCGKCGRRLSHADSERMLYCPACDFKVYPTIFPCIIVAVYAGSRLLLTRSLGRPPGRYGLVAGFVEVGESLEQAVAREVAEEVGLKVKNIRFYKSQPWPFTDSLLAGFFAELDGNAAITIQTSELAEALWQERQALHAANQLSLTGEMIEMFRTGANRP